MNREGWVPIRLVGSFVDWCWLGEGRFTEPFFDGTIERAMRKPFNGLFTHRTSMDELGAWFAESPGLAPSGFIFHMSRCGSTVVSQMLAASAENVVISEAWPLDRLARACAIPEAVRAEWLRWMVSALGQKRTGKESRYFIKFDSPTVLVLPFLRRVFPLTPWIFVYRDPEEVLASHLRQPAAAMARGFITDVRTIDASMEDVFGMSEEEYAARVIGRLCESAVNGMDERGLLVNYTQLPGAVWDGVARHFGVVFSAEETARMQEAATRNAKRPREKFVADGESKRMEVAGVAQQAAARWIWPQYEKLERLRGALERGSDEA